MIMGTKTESSLRSRAASALGSRTSSVSAPAPAPASAVGLSVGNNSCCRSGSFFSENEVDRGGEEAMVLAGNSWGR